MSTFNEEEWDKIDEQRQIDFYNFPLTISLPYKTLDEYNKAMDEPFTDKKTIIVKDDRASESSYYWTNVPKNELAQYINYTVVNMVDDKPITLRQIFTEISKDPHYHRDIIFQQNHRFIERINWDSDIQISFWFGS
tara:strand:+ start:553 stop:960 length:408 start_codon:yes stop_codon:yes gene_type:complete